MTDRYSSVNDTWPAELPKPTPQEAMTGAKRLFRKFMGRAWRGKWKFTSGRRQTRNIGATFYVNPDEVRDHGGGWPAIVHSMSHHVHGRKYPTDRPHNHNHAFIEREMIRYVLASGWLDGKLRRPDKPKPAAVDRAAVRYARVLARITAWEGKRKRAENALKKLRRQRAYYEKRAP
jgi:hypothetical protein